MLPCFNMTTSPCTNQEEEMVFQFCVEERTELHRVRTSTPSNTFEMNWKADCEPDVYPTSSADLTDAFVADWRANPCSQFPKSRAADPCCMSPLITLSLQFMSSLHCPHNKKEKKVSLNNIQSRAAIKQRDKKLKVFNHWPTFDIYTNCQH